MGGLVEDLLLLAELDRGRPLRAEPVGPPPHLRRRRRRQQRVRPRACQLTMAPGREVVVLGDAERLTQVAHNLVRNALAHTPPGTTVTVSTRAERGMGVIRVTDNGPGIDPRWPPGSSTASPGDPSRTGPGTGLGLAIVRAIAEALGWLGRVPSPPGRDDHDRGADPVGAGAPGRRAPAPRRSPQVRRTSGHQGLEHRGQLDVGLGRLGLGVGVGHHARRRHAGVRVCRPGAGGRCGCRSSTRRCRRRRPSRPGRPSSRGTGSGSAMVARASSRGVPPTAGVGCTARPARGWSSAPARCPSIRVPRWATERKATSEGSAGTVRSSHSGRRAARWRRPRSGARPVLGRCGQAPWASASERAVSPRGTVPASGWHQIRRPCGPSAARGRPRRRSRRAPGTRRWCSCGSCARRRRNTARRGEGAAELGRHAAGQDRPPASPDPGARMVATARATMSR
jgi:hypothetical protein